MLTRLRRRALPVAVALLVSVLALGIPHSFDPHHDADWDATVIHHEESAHQVGEPDGKQDNHPLHCLACHWARSFRLRSISAHLAPPDAKSAKLVHSHVVPESSGQGVVQPPLRGPPGSPRIV